MKTPLMLLCLALLLSGCGGGDGSSSAPQVDRAAVASITLSHSEVTLSPGESVQLSATLRNAGGEVIQGRNVSWQSADASTASVTADGLVRAVRAGDVVISATAEGKMAAARVAINAPPTVSRIELDTLSARLEEGNSLQLRVTAYDSAGNLITGRGEQWSTSTDGIIGVSASGLVTALRTGVAVVNVRIDGQQTSASINVFAQYDHDLLHGSAAVGEHAELFSVDLNDPSLSHAMFPPGRHASHASPSPRGDRIAFVVFGGWDAGNWQSMIYLVNRDGSGVMRLTHLAARNDSPTWSPDGTRIAFSSQPSGERADIWVINADGSQPVDVTADLADSSQISPSWSPAIPGGERIAFTRRLNGLGKLWTMRPDGSDKSAVTASTEFDDDEASWSPDGQQLVFRRTGVGVFSDLYRVASTGGTGLALMPGVALPFDQLAPAWSPDGRLIAFVSKHAGGEHYQVWTVWSDGTRLAQRTFDGLLHSDPAWIRRF